MNIIRNTEKRKLYLYFKVNHSNNNEKILGGGNVSMAFSTSQMPKNLVKSRVEDE